MSKAKTQTKARNEARTKARIKARIKAQKTATSGEKPRPWPYPDIRRPPLLAGVDLISVPEAVGILGAKLHPDDWRYFDPPWKWREAWYRIRLGRVLVREEGNPVEVYRDAEGNVIGTIKERRTELPEATARARKLLFEPDAPEDPEAKDRPFRSTLFHTIRLLLATGRVRSLVAWGSTPDDRRAPLSVQRYAEPLSPFWQALNAGGDWGEVVEPFAEMCWNSLLRYPSGPTWDSNLYLVYLPYSDIDHIGEKEIEEVEKENWIAVARLLLSNHPRADNKDVIAHLETEGYTVVLPTDDDVTGRIVITSPKGVTADPLVASFYSMLSRARRPD